MVRKIVAMATLVVMLTLLSSGDVRGAFAQTAANPFPAPTGPYKIGTVIRQWVDKSRDEDFTEAPDDKRQLLVQFWYPADSKAGGTLARHISASDTCLTMFEA